MIHLALLVTMVPASVSNPPRIEPSDFQEFAKSLDGYWTATADEKEVIVRFLHRQNYLHLTWFEIADESNYPFLRHLEPLMGRWSYAPTSSDSDPRDLIWSPWSAWRLNRNILQGFVKVDGKAGTTITARDGTDKQIKQWIFWNRGGYDVHVLTHEADRWGTEFRGVNELGEKVEGRAEYRYRELSELSSVQLTYQETRHVEGQETRKTAFTLTRKGLTPADTAKPSPGI